MCPDKTYFMNQAIFYKPTVSGRPVETTDTGLLPSLVSVIENPKLLNHQNINTTNPTRKEIRFPFHYHVTFRVCPTAKSSHRAKIVLRG